MDILGVMRQLGASDFSPSFNASPLMQRQPMGPPPTYGTINRPQMSWTDYLQQLQAQQAQRAAQRQQQLPTQQQPQYANNTNQDYTGLNY